MLYIFIQDVTCRINRSYPLSLGRIFMDISVLTESLFGLVLGHVFLGSIILGYCIFLFGLFQKGIQLTLCNGTQNHDFVRDFPLEPPEAPPKMTTKTASKNEVDIFMNTWCLETFWLNIRNIWECLGWCHPNLLKVWPKISTFGQHLRYLWKSKGSFYGSHVGGDQTWCFLNGAVPCCFFGLVVPWNHDPWKRWGSIFFP